MYRFPTPSETRMKQLFYIKQSHICILFFCNLRTCKKPILPIILKYVFNQSSQSSSTTNKTNQTKGSKSPRHHIILYYSHTPKRNNQTNLSNVKSKAGYPIIVSFWRLPQLGGCPLHYTPVEYFQFQCFNYNIIISPTPNYLQHLFDSCSLYITALKHPYNFNLYLPFLIVVEFKFFLIGWNLISIAEIHILLMS